MNSFKKLWCRTYQTAFRIILPLLPYREPKVLETNEQVAEMLEKKQLKHVFFVTDKNVRGLGLTKCLEEELAKKNIAVTMFDEVLPNPTIVLVERGLKIFLQNNCDCIVALGGGSVMDCAKVVGARVVKPNQSVSGMKGLLKVGKKLPTLVAIPTTAGTGSETTLAAVITDEKTHEKYAINDFCLIPHYALLDYNLTTGLPPFVTVTTGMDALTHAVEAYIGRSTTRHTRKCALEAIKLIYENLEAVFDDGKNAAARQNMLRASYLAGVAFTESYVGYVHAIAHSLGGAYGVAHGLANSVILPVMLREYGASATKKLAEIANFVGIYQENDAKSAENFIVWIENLLQKFNLPTTISELKAEDIPLLATRADKEANPLYPVPNLMDAKELEKVYQKLLAK